jgi:cation diffusion facilitator CzcD-associated flavoprotein CzcO
MQAVDVIIIGAGLSGIGAARQLQVEMDALLQEAAEGTS